MKTSLGVDLFLLPPLIFVVDWGQELASCPGYFTRDENSGYLLNKGYARPMGGVDEMEKSFVVVGNRSPIPSRWVHSHIPR